MDLAIVRGLKPRKWGFQKVFFLLPLAVDEEQNTGEVRPCMEFAQFRDVVRNIDDLDFHLCRKDHNVPYHWILRQKHDSHNEAWLKVYPLQEGRVWLVVVRPEYFTSRFEPTTRQIAHDNVEFQFRLPFINDYVGEDGQPVRHVSNGCISMFRVVVRGQRDNLADEVINAMREDCDRVLGQSRARKRKKKPEEPA